MVPKSEQKDHQSWPWQYRKKSKKVFKSQSTVGTYKYQWEKSNIKCPSGSKWNQKYSHQMAIIKTGTRNKLIEESCQTNLDSGPHLTSPDAGSTAFSRSDTAPASVLAALIKSFPPPTSSSISAASSFTPFDISVRLEEMVVIAQPTAV